MIRLTIVTAVRNLIQARMESAGWWDRLRVFFTVFVLEHNNQYGKMRPVVAHYVLTTFVWFFFGRIGYVFCSFCNRIINHYKRAHRERVIK